MDAPRDASTPAIPQSQCTVDVYIIDTTTRVGGVPASYYLAPSHQYPGLSMPGESTPSYSFLIEHASSRTKLLFDLGLRVDWKTASAPGILKWARSGNVEVSVEEDVASILCRGGIDPMDITALIFSHQHFDHTGDPRRFSGRAKIIVGPGYKQAFLPGWPENKQAWETTSDLYRDREVIEVSFSQGNDLSGELQIGGFRALDYFGDGSFYLLDTPGHTVAHISALARTTPSVSDGEQTQESTFILLGGDVAHDCALFRPSPMCPLPEIVMSDTSDNIAECNSGRTFTSVHREYSDQDNGQKARSTPFCIATGPHHDVSAAQRSIDVLGTFDGLANVFTVLSHDPSVAKVVDLFPKKANEWMANGWRETCRWKFLPGLMGPQAGPTGARRRAKI